MLVNLRCIVGIGVKMKSLIFATCALILWTGRIQAQDVAPPVPEHAPETRPDLARRPVDRPAINETIALTVPKGTPVQVALDKEVRPRKVGQPIHARVVEPI